MNFKSHVWKVLVIILYNISLSFMIFSTDWNDWGAIVMYPGIWLIILLFTPILVSLLFVHHKKKWLFVVISLIITICSCRISFFLQDKDNINNLVENQADNKKVEEILSSEEYVEVGSSKELKFYIQLANAEAYIIYTEPLQWGTNDVIERKMRLQQIKLIQDNSITDEIFNKNIIYTNKVSYLNNNVVINIKSAYYDTDYKNEMLIKMNNTYYRVDSHYSYLSEEIAETNIIQDKILTMMGVESYEVGKEESYTWFEFYSNSALDYIIVRKKVGAAFELDEKVYMCNLEGKDDSQRLEEYKKYLYKDDEFNPQVIKNTYILNNDKIYKVITYDFGDRVSWNEIIFKDLNYSIFTHQSYMPAIEGRSVE